MRADDIVTRLSALAHDARLDICRALARAGAEGLAAADLAGRAKITPPSLTHHAKILMHAGILGQERQGRSVVYRLRPEAVGDVAEALATLAAEA